MSLLLSSSGKRRNTALLFTRALILLFTFQVWFVLSETDSEDVTYSNEAALLKELSGSHLYLSASPV